MRLSGDAARRVASCTVSLTIAGGPQTRQRVSGVATADAMTCRRCGRAIRSSPRRRLLRDGQIRDPGGLPTRAPPARRETRTPPLRARCRSASGGSRGAVRAASTQHRAQRRDAGAAGDEQHARLGDRLGRQNDPNGPSIETACRAPRAPDADPRPLSSIWTSSSRLSSSRTRDGALAIEYGRRTDPSASPTITAWPAANVNARPRRSSAESVSAAWRAPRSGPGRRTSLVTSFRERQAS